MRIAFRLTTPIQSLEVSYLMHSTEDPDKLASAVEKTLGINAAPTIEELEGHFGNRIVHVVYHLTGQAASSAFVELARGMPSSVKREVFRNIGDMLDEHSAMYLRLDRQSLVRGELALGGTEPVRVRVKPRLFLVKGGAAEFYRGILGGTG